MNFDIMAQLSAVADMLVLWLPKLAGGVLVLVLGFWAANLAVNIVGKAMRRAKLDPDVQPFLKSLVGVLLKVLVVVTAAGIIGIEVTAFAAFIAAAGLAVGLAMQGSLSHFAAGVLVLIFKPYRVGDLVELQGQLGHVLEIQVFNTVLRTLDHKKVIIPNGVATSGIMTNLTAEGKLRVDLNVAMAYEEDFDKVRGVIRAALERVTERLPDEPTIEIERYTDGNIVLCVRPYATAETYWDVYFKSYKYIREGFVAAGIEVAYPKLRIGQGA